MEKIVNIAIDKTENDMPVCVCYETKGETSIVNAVFIGDEAEKVIGIVTGQEIDLGEVKHKDKEEDIKELLVRNVTLVNKLKSFAEFVYKEVCNGPVHAIHEVEMNEITDKWIKVWWEVNIK